MGQVALKVQVGPALVQRRNTSVWQEGTKDGQGYSYSKVGRGG